KVMGSRRMAGKAVMRDRARPGMSELDPAHHESRQEADDAHDRPPGARGVDDGLAAVDGAEDDVGDGLGLAGERRRLQARGEPVLPDPGLDADGAQAGAAKFVVEPLEIARQAGLGGTIEDDGLPTALARHRREHAEGAAAAREEPAPRLLAEE